MSRMQSLVLRGAASVVVLATAIWVLALGPSSSRADVQPHGGMLRYPAISADKIAFVYADDLWVVDRDGGRALPLASPTGPEQRPRFSPDGQYIAFEGNYDGGSDLYVVPTVGGVARRVTYHPTREELMQWTADGKLLFASGAQGGPKANHQLFTIDPEGGMADRLPVVFGRNGRLSADGRWLAFTPHSRDHRTWKRYRGGMATDIWIYDMKEGTAQQITDWEGTDTEPMWIGKTVYYVSDQGGEHRWNLWAYDTTNGERRQVTRFRDYDVKYPSVGPGPSGKGEIIFQKGAGIHVLDVQSGRVRQVEVTIPGDQPTLRPVEKKVARQIFSWDISPTGKRLILGARGDIWSLPAEHGPAINITRSQGVADRSPEWSPDGRWIAWLSDESGEYEIYLQQSDGKDEPRRLGKFGAPFRIGLSWSPDSKTIAYADKTGTLYLVDVESAKRTKVYSDYWGSNNSMSWSHDSRWIAHGGGLENGQSAIFLYDVEAGKDHQVTSGMFNDYGVTFDRKGDFLYYVSNRDFTSPTYEDVGTTFVYDQTAVVLMVPLRDDVEIPGGLKEDLETWEDESKDDSAEATEDKDDSSKDEDASGEESDEGEDEAEAEPLKIDLDGFESRALPLDIEHGNIFGLSVTDAAALLYVRFGDSPSVNIFDPAADEPEEKTVAAGFRGYRLSADGKKLALRRRGSFEIVDAKADQKFEGKISTDELSVEVDPRAEWHQIFQDAWRFERDFFYDPNMHGVDWNAVRKQYSAMLEDCTSRADLLYVIREMISELNVGHAYAFGGDIDSGSGPDVGMLGVDYELSNGAYRIAKIYEGGPWDSDVRSVFSRAGVEVEVGEYVLAVNGVPVDASKSVYASFLGTSGQTTRVTVGPKPSIDEDSRDILVQPLSSEFGLRYRAWIEAARKYVEEKSNGRVGYIYVPDTGVNGQNNLFRQFYGQRGMDALIIDERWNGGGQIPTRFVELLNRPITNYWATRDGERKIFTWPPDAHAGPKCMLINGLAGSGGDAFPAYFRQAGLGPLIGERTWGGLVGISGGPPLVDGAFLSEPSFAYFDKDMTWGIEGYGVDPDIEVVADPAALARGVDPQLDRAIAEMLAELEASPPVVPEIPDYPNRSGMGIPERDH